MVYQRLTRLADVEAGIKAAMEHQESVGKPLSCEALAWALNIDRHDVKAYAEGKYIPRLAEDGSNSEEVAEAEAVASAMARARNRCIMEISNFATDRGNMMGPTFLLKNNYGYTDKSEQTLTVEVPIISGEGELLD